MNRREFLQSLAAIGASLAGPAAALASASEPVIDQAWAALLDDPMVFYVNELGMLSSRTGIEGVDIYVTRGELLEYQQPPRQPEELIEYIRDLEGLERHIDHHHSGHDFDLYPNWRDYIREGDIDAVRQTVIDWLNDDPNDDDYTRANLWGNTGRADAMYWFQGRATIAVSLNITFSDYFQPASPYYGAVLLDPIELTNQRARENGLPICFESADC